MNPRVVWFVIGNTVIFNADSCQTTAPLLFRLCLAWIIVGYVKIMIPFFICCVFLFCFPCVHSALARFTVIVEDSGVLERRLQAINQLRHVTFEAGSIPPEDAMCAICLENYVPGQSEVSVCFHLDLKEEKEEID